MFASLKLLFSRKKSLVAPIIAVTVKLDDRCGEEIATDLEKNTCLVTKDAKKIILGIFSKPGTYRVGLIRGEDIPYKKLTHSRVRRFGKRHGYKLLPLEVGPFLRKKISDEDLMTAEIWWVGCMSETVEGRFSYHKLILGFGRNSVNGSWFGTVETHFLSDMGALPIDFSKGGAYAFLLPE